ncbi:hypothetical protein HPG69_019733 [Diceros bicornis minor]|uniref:Uncharacterized protein n=1 Tax=Diceros bicornis minor TaxID=77932 RepID=A0A7J7EGU7_DICBM|nr:hypothetical protein HPG69_019733 [Diceros bicornis minor]
MQDRTTRRKVQTTRREQKGEEEEEKRKGREGKKKGERESKNTCFTLHRARPSNCFAHTRAHKAVSTGSSSCFLRIPLPLKRRLEQPCLHSSLAGKGDDATSTHLQWIVMGNCSKFLIKRNKQTYSSESSNLKTPNSCYNRLICRKAVGVEPAANVKAIRKASAHPQSQCHPGQPERSCDDEEEANPPHQEPLSTTTGQ